MTTASRGRKGKMVGTAQVRLCPPYGGSTLYASTCALSCSSDASGAARSTTYFLSASLDSTLQVDRGRVVDDVAVIAEVVGDVLHGAEIMQP